jgi:hypothetical protein
MNLTISTSADNSLMEDIRIAPDNMIVTDFGGIY